MAENKKRKTIKKHAGSSAAILFLVAVFALGVWLKAADTRETTDGGHNNPAPVATAASLEGEDKPAASGL